MLNLSQRLGIFVKERKKSKSYKTRYFFIDNNYNLIYSSNQAYIEKQIKSSETINEIISKLSNKKKFCFRGAKIGALKLFATLESIPLANKNCFEIFIENPTDPNVYTTLVIFSAQDDDIGYLHEFLKSYDSYADSLKKQLNVVHLPVRNSITVNTENSPNRGQQDKIQSKLEEEYNETFSMLLDLIEQYDKERRSKPAEEDFLLLVEDLQSNKNVQLEEHQLSKLENGSSYSGKMRNGKPYGQGTEFFKEGISYVGEFRNGKKHGQGYIVNSNLDMTTAEFINGRPVGI